MQPELSEFLRQHRITEVEAIIPDMAGIARGKIIPRNKFNPANRCACHRP